MEQLSSYKPFCIDCNKEIIDMKHLAFFELFAITEGARPKYSRHKKCDKPIKILYGGHFTPPGLDEIERYRY